MHRGFPSPGIAGQLPIAVNLLIGHDFLVGNRLRQAAFDDRTRKEMFGQVAQAGGLRYSETQWRLTFSFDRRAAGINQDEASQSIWVSKRVTRGNPPSHRVAREYEPIDAQTIDHPAKIACEAFQLIVVILRSAGQPMAALVKTDNAIIWP